MKNVLAQAIHRNAEVSAKKVTPEKSESDAGIMGNLIGGKKAKAGKVSFGKKIIN